MKQETSTIFFTPAASAASATCFTPCRSSAPVSDLARMRGALHGCARNARPAAQARRSGAGTRHEVDVVRTAVAHPGGAGSAKDDRLNSSERCKHAKTAQHVPRQRLRNAAHAVRAPPRAPRGPARASRGHRAAFAHTAQTHMRLPLTPRRAGAPAGSVSGLVTSAAQYSMFPRLPRGK